MKNKIWEAEFEGRNIRITNRASMFPFHNRECLEVDDQLVATGKARLLAEFVIIKALVEFSGVTRQVEVRIAGLKGRFFTTGCHILIDGMLVGGDTERTLILPDIAEARTRYLHQPRQFIRRFFIRNVLEEGLPFAALMLLITTPQSVVEGLFFFVCGLIGFGLTIAWMNWRSLRPALQ
ncbi:MAG: hypothetical protein ACOYLF_06355 [Blastocatellia bacterium]